MSEIFGNGVMGGGGLTNSKLALANAQAADVRSGKKFYAGDKQIKTGTLADVTQATPAITVDAAGKITASATQAAGVVAAGTKSATKQLPVQAAKTVIPSASAQTAVGEGVFTTGIVTVAAVYAVIGVTYPSGSVCTCTNGTLTLTAKNTSGKAIFVIPSAGTWTVKAVSGSNTASKSVSITADGQVATVTLSYDLVLFSGSETWTIKKRIDDYGSLAISNSKLTLTGSMAYGGSAPLYSCSAFYPSKVAKSSYSTLKVTVSAVTTPTNVYLIVQNDMTANSIGSNYVASVNITEAGTFSVPYPDGTYYVGLTVGGTSSVTVSKVWLEQGGTT